jgi:flagellar biosynthetic protein FlhB
MTTESNQEKTEKATPKKREDARKKGRVAFSREIPSAFILLLSLGAFYFWGHWMFTRLTEFMTVIFSRAATLQLHDENLQSLSIMVFRSFVIILLPLMGAVFFGGIAGNIAQVGFLITGEPLSPKLSKLNPLNGLKRLFSLRSLNELVKALIKMVIVGCVAYLTVKGDLLTIPGLMHCEVGEIFAYTGSMAFKICLFSCLVLIILAALDYAYQRWQYESDLKMTRQEVKDELKQREGDPTTKLRIRRLQLEMAQRRMMEEVPKADVVITNPTHLAIALKFDVKKMIAPKVVAKGADHIAQRIKDIARDHGIPVVEDKPLAQILFKTVEIGECIPVDLYRAVAQILAYVYRLKGCHRVV